MTSRYSCPAVAGSPPLEDARNHITRLPKAEHEAGDWQAAMEALILVADLGGPTMFARIGVLKALNRQVERVFDPYSQRASLGAPQASEGPMTVLIYVNTSKQVGDADHLKVLASRDAADTVAAGK